MSQAGSGMRELRAAGPETVGLGAMGRAEPFRESSGRGLSRRVPSIGEVPEVTASSRGSRPTTPLPVHDAAPRPSHAARIQTATGVLCGSHRLALLLLVALGLLFCATGVLLLRAWTRGGSLRGLPSAQPDAPAPPGDPRYSGAGMPLPQAGAARAGSGRNGTARTGATVGKRAWMQSHAQRQDGVPLMLVAVAVSGPAASAKEVARIAAAVADGVVVVDAEGYGEERGSGTTAADRADLKAIGAVLGRVSLTDCGPAEAACREAHLDGALEVLRTTFLPQEGDAVAVLAGDEFVDAAALGAALRRASLGQPSALLLRRFVWSLRWRAVHSEHHTVPVLPGHVHARCAAAEARAQLTRAVEAVQLASSAATAIPRSALLCGDVQVPLDDVSWVGAQVSLLGTVRAAAAALRRFHPSAWALLPRASAVAVVLRASEHGRDLLRCSQSAGAGTRLTLDACPLLREVPRGVPLPGLTASVQGAVRAAGEAAAEAPAADAAALPGDPAAACDAVAAAGRLGLDPRSVAIAVISSVASIERARDVEAAWARRARAVGIRVAMVLDQPADGFPDVVVCPGRRDSGPQPQLEDGPGSHKAGVDRWPSRCAFDALLTGPRAAWLFRTTDDAFVSVDNLLRALALHDASQPLALADPVYFARQGSSQPSPPLQRPFPFHHPSLPVQVYPSGGVGWVLSRPAAEALASRWDALTALEAGSEPREDVVWGMLLADFGVPVSRASCLSQYPLRPAHLGVGLPDCPRAPTVPSTPAAVQNPYPPLFRPCAVNAALYRGRLSEVREAVDVVCGDFATFCSDGAQHDMCSADGVVFV